MSNPEEKQEEILSSPPPSPLPYAVASLAILAADVGVIAALETSHPRTLPFIALGGILALIYPADKTGKLMASRSAWRTQQSK